VTANDAPYDLARVTEEKCFGAGFSGDPVVRVWGDFLGVAVSCGRYLRVLVVDRAHRRRGIGSALLQDAEERGVSVIGAEPGNYFTPGVWADDAGARAFFRSRGLTETRETHNLAVSAAPHPGPLPARATPEDRERVLAFIEREFGKIWRFEAASAFDEDEPLAFVTEEDGEITGFAVHEVNNRGLGFFGPTGVAKSMRGRGLGCALLQASLADLHRMGHGRVVIPWTDALDFYRKCSGAEAAHRFIAFAKPRS
jgi:GNAT superfamily N-acetyltransferase